MADEIDYLASQIEGFDKLIDELVRPDVDRPDEDESDVGRLFQLFSNVLGIVRTLKTRSDDQQRMINALEARTAALRTRLDKLEGKPGA